MDWQTGALGALFIYSAVITILYVRRSRRLKYRFRKALSRRVDVHRSALKTEDDARFQAAADEALRLTQTFQKFVPRQFVEHMANSDVDSLGLGLLLKTMWLLCFAIYAASQAFLSVLRHRS